MRKSPAEVAALAEAGAAIDAVHLRMGEWLRAGRTEAEVAVDIARRDPGVRARERGVRHRGQRPQWGQPRTHAVSDRVIGPGEPVVVDNRRGDAVGVPVRLDPQPTSPVGAPAPAAFLAYYEVLREAQRAAVAAVAPGVPAQDVDAPRRAT